MSLDLFEYAAAHVPSPCHKEMPEATLETLAMLQKKGAAGITWDDFPIGFALRSRISDLRKQGYIITTRGERLTNGSVRARYVLLEGPCS